MAFGQCSATQSVIHRAPSLEYGQRMPILRIERVAGATNDWNVSVWENTGERDMRRSAYFDPTPRQLV